MRRAFTVVALAALCTVGCGGGPAGPPGAMMFSGVVDGSAILAGEGPGHICGPQSNGAYSAALTTRAGGKRVVVNVQVSEYKGPMSYELGGGNVVTLSIQGMSSETYGPAWQSTDGNIVIDSTGYAGSIQTNLAEVSPEGHIVSSADAEMKGHWSCSSP